VKKLRGLCVFRYTLLVVGVLKPTAPKQHPPAKRLSLLAQWARSFVTSTLYHKLLHRKPESKRRSRFLGSIIWARKLRGFRHRSFTLENFMVAPRIFAGEPYIEENQGIMFKVMIGLDAL